MPNSSRTPLFSPVGWALTVGLALIAWAACLAPTGMHPRELAIFAAPGALLWVGVGCAAHSAARQDISWQSALRWLVLGATLLPPLFGLLVAVAGLERPTQVLAVFTLTAWVTLLVGGAFGAFVALVSRR